MRLQIGVFVSRVLAMVDIMLEFDFECEFGDVTGRHQNLCCRWLVYGLVL